VHERLNPGGLLLIASPYTWLEEHTKREEWIGGFKKDGENFTTLDGLKAMLGEALPPAGEPRRCRSSSAKRSASSSTRCRR
jgi:hypothetical protein